MCSDPGRHDITPHNCRGVCDLTEWHFSAPRAYQVFVLDTACLSAKDHVYEMKVNLKMDMDVSFIGHTRVDILRVWAYTEQATLDLRTWAGISTLRILEITMPALPISDTPSDMIPAVVNLNYQHFHGIVVVNYSVQPKGLDIYDDYTLQTYQGEVGPSVILRAPLPCPMEWTDVVKTSLVVIIRVGCSALCYLPFPFTFTCEWPIMCYVEMTSSYSKYLGTQLPVCGPATETYMNTLEELYHVQRRNVRDRINTPLTIQSPRLRTPIGKVAWNAYATPASPMPIMSPPVGPTCTVCLSRIEPSMEIQGWACHHALHRGCYWKYRRLGNSVGCPECRNSVEAHLTPVESIA